MTQPFLEGPRVLLCVPDRDALARANVDWTSDREVVRYLSRGTFPLTMAEAQRDFDSKVGSRSDVELAVIDRESGDLAGVTGLHSLNWVARSAEFRILLGHKGVWRKGLGTEACQLIVAYGFELLNMNRVWLGVNEDNVAALRSYEKSGFAREGVLRAEVFRNGRFYDVVRMSILRDEYEAKRASWPVFSWIQRQFPR